VADLLRDPSRLRKRLEKLQELKRSRQLDSDGMEALAECNFRLAVHPKTAVAESLDLLHRAFKIDGANPKFAYHLARLYFIHGELKQASAWLRLAARLCPTSHRIWAHISLLQRELNAIYKGKPGLEPDDLRKRGEKIAEAVKAGKDNLDPDLIGFEPQTSLAALQEKSRRDGAPLEAEPSPDEQPTRAPAPPEAGKVRRFLNPNQCRWSGINDLVIEQMLEAEPGRRTLKQLFGLLQQMAASAGERRNGASAFAILGIQWIIRGYPVATISRLRTDLPPAGSSSLELLDRVCTLYEADERELPALLAEAVDDERIPPLLAALIHQRRLLWKPLEFRNLVTYRAARKFLAQARQEKPKDENAGKAQVDRANEYVKRLTNAVRALNPERPAQLEDVQPQAAAETAQATPSDRVAALLQKSQTTKTGLDEAWLKLKALAGARQDGSFGQDEKAAAAEIKRFVEEAMNECSLGLGDIAQIRASGSVTPETLLQLDAAEKQLQNNEQRRGPFKKNLARLPLADVAPMNEAARETTSDDTVQAAVRAAEPAPELDGLAALEQAIERADHEITRRFKEANASFTYYSRTALRSPPLRAIRVSVRARQAETLYRLGRRREAKRIWSELLKEDRLDVNVLKNLAVCDTAESDIGNTLASWRSYVEALYFYDIVGGSPRPHSGARSDFHRAFGDAYAPAFLFEELTKDWSDKVEDGPMQSFLGSPGRVRSFVDHKLLEFFNAKLDFTSPPLMLGVSRSEGEQIRAQARERLLDFASSVCALLPERVHGAFADLSKRHIEEAFEACSSARRIMLRKDTRYPEEEPRQINLIADICKLKYKLVIATKKTSEMVRHMDSVEFLQQLARLDTIPIGQSPEFLKSAAGSLGIANPAEVLDWMKDLSDKVISALLKFIFAEGGDPAEEALRQRQYKRLVGQWVKAPVLASYLDLIDDPQPLYPEAVINGFKTGELGSSVLNILRGWHERYPELTGPARHLALMLNQEKRFDESLKVLDRACSSGFHRARVVSCYYDRSTVWYSRGAEASHAKNRDETMTCLRQSLKDAAYVIANSEVEEEKAQAKKREEELKKYLSG